MFQRLRHGGKLYDVADECRSLAPMCDLIRFADYKSRDHYRERFSGPTAELLDIEVKQASNRAIELPPAPNVAEFHAICDFANWGLTRIAEGQMDQQTAGHFGYDMHNFPRGGGYGRPELVEAYRQAAAGELPSPGRIAIRARLQLS